jgi:hypothetical protein
MPGLMARILSRRANGAPPAAPPEAARSADPPTEVAAAEQPTVVAEPVVPPPEAAPTSDAGTPDADAADLPAGAERVPDGAPSFISRGRLRRRLRYLRRVRELAFRDLGGLVFDLDRFGRERPDLVDVKLAGLRSIDGELRALEVALGDVRDVEELDEPGITSCAHCGALHGSDDRFCPACGRSVDEPVEPPAPAAEEPEGGEAAADPPAA